jgi:hypothetical protein
VARVSGGDPQAVHAWFAEGMLINVVASISNATTMEEFFQSLPGGAVAPC